VTSRCLSADFPMMYSLIWEKSRSGAVVVEVLGGRGLIEE
jgi:hypothetical protein